MLLAKKPIGTIAYMGGVFTIPEKFVWSLTEMIQYNTEYLCDPGQVIFYDRATVSYHSFARNQIVERMRGDWLLMLDTDHSFEPDLAMRMLKTMDDHHIDVLTALYQYKSPPYSPLLYIWNEKSGGFDPIGDWDNNVDIFPIGSAGGGTLMVRKKIFDRIREELKENPFDAIHPFSEDHSFFKRLIDLKIPAYCSTKIQSYHLRVEPTCLRDYNKSELKFSKKQKVEGKILV